MKKIVAMQFLVAMIVALLAFPSISAAQNVYSVSGPQILKSGTVARFVGANALHQYGAGSSDMRNYGLTIVREIVTLKAAPLTGSPVQVGGSWYHSLQSIVDNNRASGLVTILCPFSYWNGTEAINLLGQNPSQTWFWEDYKAEMRSIANQFKNQPDVWIEVWNEPYMYDNSNGYSPELWLSDMRAMVDNIRSTGASNIVLVPGNETGQSEQVILTHGAQLLAGRSNIAFDIHAYEKWLYGSKENVKQRLSSLRNSGFAVIIGEVGPKNVELIDPSNFLAAVKEEGNSTLAWIWKYDSNDQDALLDSNGNPNNNNNYNWGTTYKSFVNSFYSGVPAGGVLPDGTYRITSRRSGKVIDVSWYSYSNGAGIHQWAYTSGNNQKWQVTHLGNGEYKIIAVHSGKSLDIPNASTSNGVQLQQWDYWGGANKRFKIEPVGSYYKITAVHSGKVLDVYGASLDNGAIIIQWDWHGGENQQWSFDAP